MGQEQSYSHTSPRYPDHDAYRTTQSADYRSNYEYKRHKPRRSTDSFKSDNSNSSGYRSASSACECSTEYYHTSLYKNDHYKDKNKELYKPVKIPKEKRYKLQLFDIPTEEKSSRIKTYLSDTEKSQTNTQKKTGIRNYTPKILEEEQRKKEWA